MRLDFNIVVVDDDFSDIKSSKCRSINELIEAIKAHIENKGFIPKFCRCISMDHCLKDESIDGERHNHRIDLYLSDNNLGGKDSDGIDLYLKLKESKFLCDFILYTRSNIEEIVQKLSKDLNEKKDPNLFTRFTFLSRSGDPSDNSWHQPIKDILDHIITAREEINNLRGLFAQVTAEIHNKMRDLLKNERISFGDAIDEIAKRKIINEKLKGYLLTQHARRNNIVHNDEFFDEKKKVYVIECKEKSGAIQTYYHEDFPKLRKHLLSTKEDFFKQINK